MATPALVEASEIASRLASPDEPASLTIARREVLAHIVDLERNNEPAPEVGIKRQVRARAWFATLPHELPSHTDILAIGLTPALSHATLPLTQITPDAKVAQPLALPSFLQPTSQYVKPAAQKRPRDDDCRTCQVCLRRGAPMLPDLRGTFCSRACYEHI